MFLSVNKFLLTTLAVKTFHNLNVLKLFWHTEAVAQSSSPGEGCSADVMWNFGGDPCVAVISIKLESGFVEIALLHGFSPVDLLHDFRIIFLEEHLWRIASEHR